MGQDQARLSSRSLEQHAVSNGGKEDDRQDVADRGTLLENVPVNDVLNVYLAEMGAEPLLTHQEEIELAQRVQVGRQAERAMRETDYDADVFDRLQEQVEKGQAARERLGRANTRLVVSIAKRYRGSGIPFADLIQSGNVGLMRAIDRYDHETGYRFSTYATWWIRQAVSRSLANQGRIIRIPVHTGDQIRRAKKTARSLELEMGRHPTVEEIAQEMEETPRKVGRLMRWANRPLSLEQPTGKEEETELGQFIQDPDAYDPERATDTNLLGDVLEDLLSQLRPREARILRLRYGLRDGQPRTLKQVGNKIGLSRERVRQIEQEAFAKIRLVAPEYRLRQFLGAVS